MKSRSENLGKRLAPDYASLRHRIPATQRHLCHLCERCHLCAGNAGTLTGISPREFVAQPLPDCGSRRQRSVMCPGYGPSSMESMTVTTSMRRSPDGAQMRGKNWPPSSVIRVGTLSEPLSRSLWYGQSRITGRRASAAPLHPGYGPSSMESMSSMRTASSMAPYTPDRVVRSDISQSGVQ